MHEWNVLEAGRGFKLVDPDGLLAEPEYDLGKLMREDPADLLGGGDPQIVRHTAWARERAWARARWLARRCGLDAFAIWQWGVAERVSTGLLATKIGMQPVGQDMLTVADRICVPDDGVIR